MFSVRIVSTDHYMAPPIRGLDVQYADQRGSEVKKVPVVNIFGSTPAGQKTCMHVHGVFPYLYVPYDGTVPWDRYLRQFATSLDKAINVAQGHGQSSLQHVYKVMLVTGRSMYGFHDKEQQFLKIYFYNPSMVKKAADLLLGGAVLNKPFQPHEAHIPYTLQLFIDYNLYGMNLINVAAVKFRKNSQNADTAEVPLSQGSDEGIGSDPKTPSTPFTALLNRSGSMTPSQKLWQRENIPRELYLDDNVEKLSTCELEVDVVAADILNRLEVGANIGTNPGLAALWEDERQRRRDRGDTTDIAPAQSQERSDVEVADSELMLRDRLQQILQDLQPYMDSQSDTESEQSQDLDFPLTQASELDLHQSQDAGQSPDIDMLNAEDIEGDNPVVDIQSIQRVVSFSQSFCDVRPELNKISSQDKSLVDILASLADDSSPPGSQLSAVELVAMEEPDSILSQTTPVESQDAEKEEEQEILEMSQQIWEGENKPDAADDDNYDLEGLDDTWVDSQLEPDRLLSAPDTTVVTTTTANDSDSDSDTSDILPQYDGPPDEKGDAKQATVKRLGMRGPASNWSNRLSMPLDTGQNVVAANPFADTPSTNQNFSNYHNNQMPRFPGNWNHQGNHNWSQPIHRLPGAPQQHHLPGFQHSSQLSPPPRTQYNPRATLSPHGNPSVMIPSYPMASRNQNLPHPYGGTAVTGNQQLSPHQGQGHIQGQLSPGSYSGSQSFNTSTSQQMSPPYVAQPHHAQSSQSNVPYSPHNFTSQGSPGRYLQHPLPFSEHSPNTYSQSNMKMNVYSTKQSEIMNQSRAEFELSELQSYPELSETQELGTAYSRSNHLSTSNPAMNSMPDMQSSFPARSNQMMTQLSPNSEPLSSQNVRNSSARASSAQVSDSDSSVPMYTAQPLSAVLTSQQQRSYKERANQDSETLFKKKSSALMSNRFMANLLEKECAKSNAKLDSSSKQFPYAQKKSVTSPPAQDGDVVSFLSNAFFEHQEKCGEVSSRRGSEVSNFDQPAIRRHNSLEGLYRGDTNDSSPRSVSLQHSPRTPASDSSIQSPESVTSKQSEPFIGPITKYYTQKRILYEQISPPATPVSTSAGEFIRKPLSTSSASSRFSEQQISPLQRLLLDNSDIPQTGQSDGRPGSLSRSSLSSPSSVGSDRHSLSQQDLFPASSKNTDNKSRLYNLLAQTSAECREKRELEDVNKNSTQCLNDSQQDLFADSLLSDSGNRDTAATDSLSSLFGDENFGNSRSRAQNPVPVKDDFASLSSLENFVGSVRNESAEFGVNFDKTSVESRTVERKDTIMKSLPTSRPAVQQTSERLPATVSTSRPFSYSQETMPGQQFPSNEIPLSHSQSTDMSFYHSRGSDVNIGQSSGRGIPASRGRGRAVLQGSNLGGNFNVSHWPDYNQPKIGRGNTSARGMSPKRRGRPPGSKNSTIPADNNALGILQKKKRGRPKKQADNNDSNSMLPNYTAHSFHDHTLQIPRLEFQQQFQNNFPMHQGSEVSRNLIAPSASLNMPYASSQQTSFSQLLEGTEDDLFADFPCETSKIQDNTQQVNLFESNSIVQQEPMQVQNQFSCEVNVNQEMNFNQNNRFQRQFSSSSMSASNLLNVNPGFQENARNPSLTSAAGPFELSNGMTQPFESNQFQYNQQYQPPQAQDLYQQQEQQHGAMEQQPLSTINLCEAMQISEPGADLNPVVTASSDDLAQFLQEYDTNTQHIQSFNACDSARINHQFAESIKKLNMENMANKLAKQHQDALFDKVTKGTVSDMAAVMQLIRYRPKSDSPQKSSPAYTFRFQVPTPVYKRLKLRVKSTSDDPELNPIDFVRMHPKDARKYSLLKIGREIIRLQKLTAEQQNEIKETLKAGVKVDSIPPPVRQVAVADIHQTSSIIADLLSAESPESNEMIGTNEVENALLGSMPSDMLQTRDAGAFMTKTAEKPVFKDKKSKSMFRGRNIANIPHLKKYRAGFPYFGKGNIGKSGGPLKMRPNNRGLKPEYEDDQNIVLKDVSLTEASDGTLTPIKSRTPIAGRSPAHSSVGNVTEMENKTLESKLKGLDYELDLNQSGNSQMFQDMLIGEKELQQKQEFENTVEEFDSKSKAIEECESNEMAGVGFDSVNLLSPTDSVILSDVEYNDNSPNAIGSLETDNVVEVLNVKNENVNENSKHAKNKINEKIFNRNNAYDNVKAQIKQGEHNDKSHENGYINPFMDNVFQGKQSRSSSRDSQSRSSSRRNSAIVNDDDTSVMSAASAVTKHRLSTDGSDSSKSASKRTKRSNGSSSGGSRRSSRSSSLDFDSGKKRKSKKAKKHDYRYDSDSDGIPGVDYIVVNKFKGRKELRVVVDKLVVDDEVLLSLKSSDKKLNGIHSHKKTEVEPSVPVTNVNSNDFVKNDGSSSSAFSGYSAEFMKFLAQKQSVPSPSLDLEDGDSQDSMQCSSDCKQEVNTVRSHITGKTAQLAVKEDGSSINEEGVNNKDLETREENLDEAGNRRNGRVAVNIEGMGDFSSSSDDEDINKNNRRRLEKPQHSNKLDSKKKRVAKSIHDGSVFCSKTRRKKPKLKKTPTKLMNTLSVLHDATMEKLTTFQSFSDIEAGNSSSNQSSSRSRDLSDVDSPAKWPPRTKTPDFELYCDRANDYVSLFEDTMYKLAYLSPMSSPSSSDSPPRPLSPKEFRKLEMTNEHLNHKQEENGEKKMTMSDILKVMQSEAESVKECEVNKKEAPNTPSKIAVARTETLTFKDIQSFCLAEKDTEEKQAVKNKMESEGKMERRDESDKSILEKLVESPPPDLGPPVLETMDSQPEENSPPPKLSPNRSEMISDLSIGRGRDPLRIEKGHNAPPFLTPCRSPRVIQSPKVYVSPRCSRAPDGTENGDYFGLLVEKEVAKPGRSPGACSSSGSINVIHSEEFSDISDENDSDDEALCSKSKQIKLQKPRYANSPTMASLSSKTAPICSISENRNTFISDVDIERKKKEIKEFEERHKKLDEVNMNKPTDLKGNNIFDMFSSKNSIPISPSRSPRQNTSEINNFGLRGDGVELDRFTNRFNRSISSEFVTSSNAFQPREYAGNRQKKLECMFQPGSAAKFFQSMSSSCLSGNSMPRNGISKRNRSDFNFNGSFGNDYIKQLTNKQFPNMDLDISGEQFAQNSLFVNPKTAGHLRLSQQSETRLHRQVSGDLFDSLTSESSINSESRSVHSLQRSLSDNSRLDYSIVPNNKLNNSIMRSLQNYSNRETLRQDNDLNSAVPMIEFGGGSGRRGQRTGQWNQNQGSDSQGTQPSSLPLTSSGNYGQSLSGSQVQRGGQGHNTQTPTSGYPGCQVITPHTGPPSLESILASANQHGLAAYRSTGAFYSNYGDMPDKPREGGGHVIKLPSTLVKDLEEFEPFSSSLTSSSASSSLSSNVTGIKNWRTILTADDPLCSTQTCSENLCDKLATEPALKYALTGDQSVIITPCNLPPSRRAVEIWYQGRKVYKNLKNKAFQEDILKKDKIESKTKDKNNEKSEVNREKPEESKPKSDVKIVIEECVESKELDSEKYRLNLFTGKRELASEADFTSIIEKSEDKCSSVREKTDTGNINTDTSTQQSNLQDREEIESPKSSQERTDNMLHSTPVLRRGSTELFETECTPITGEKRPSQEDHPPGFMTPKRIRPLRRLSTNTDTTLRRAILSSQIKQQFGSPALLRADTSQIEGPSLKNSFGFKHSQQNLQDSKALHEYQYLTVLSVEVHVETRGDLRPDPEVDGILVIFYSIFNDIPADRGTRQETGAFIVDPVSANSRKDDNLSSNQKHPHISVSHDPQPGTSKAADPKPAVAPSSSKDHPEGTDSSRNLQETLLQKSGLPGLKVSYVRDEKELLETFVNFVHRWDPDILVGFEIQMLSWGYILQRASVLSMNLAQAISRVPSAKGSSHHSKEQDEYGADHMSEIHIAGRIVLNLWRLLRHEVTLNVYSFENIAFHVLHRRIPLFTFRSLTAWFKHRTHLHRWKVIEHYVTRVKGSLEVMDQLDMLGRTSEFARVFGIEFYHVLSRGSQYRVESMMLRIAKPMNYIPVSPSVHQRARMKAPECIALTLEPESKFYTDPVLVLDFQSLYPSIMIAYNYCFSTCLGRLEWFQKAHEGPIEFGCTSLNLQPSVIRKLSNDVTVSPNGVVFCKQSVKRGVIPIMVEEILNTRLMVKKAMSSYKDDKTLSRMLNARQLGLKLIANVTYGYTGANFSGRMPCIEVGDSIVRKARETLERSIKLVEETPAWGAKVVYGDTDSMFVLLKGRSKDEAFKIGYDIAKKVTDMFPKPIKLKFEKSVLNLPCLKLKEAKDVRWLSHDQAIRAVRQCLPAVVTSLEFEANEKSDAVAQGLSVFIQKYEFVAALYMMSDVLPVLSTLSRALQARDCAYSQVESHVAGTIATVKSLGQYPGEYFRSLPTAMDDLVQQPFQFKPPTETQINNFRDNVYNKFIDSVVKNLEKRFPHITELEAFGVFNPQQWPEDTEMLEDYGNEEIEVYLPCVLQTKKRYVGFMYETPDQKEPVYDAKGIETVRRDTCSAVAKILERSLKILFTSKDVSQVKSYIQQQCQKVMEGNVSLQDFVFAKEYRGIPGYKPGACVPALEIAKKQLRQDRRSEPRVGERVPYVIVYGSPGLPLIQLVRQPQEILQDPSLRLNATYYITKQILPPLDRFLSLMGASVFSWYQDMPHSAGRAVTHHVSTDQAKKGTISQYFATSSCPTCDSQTKRPICEQCMLDPQAVCVTLNDRVSRWEMVQQKLYQICGACIGTSENSTVTACVSLDCPVQFRRVRASNDLSMAQTYREILAKVFK